jgi:hypothetical protein
MPATATARKPAPRTARSAPARRAPRAGAPARRAARPPARAANTRFVPVVVGRTAVAVGGLADSGLVAGLTRSRLWIGLLAGLLVGIVGLNVAALQFNATASKTAALSDELKRENSALRAEIAGGLSNERLQGAAQRLGLVFPEPRSILNLTPGRADAATAAERLRDGAITLGSSYVPVAAVPVAPVVPVTEASVAATETTLDPAAAAAEAPVAEEVATPEPAAPTAAPTASGGASAP